MTNQEPERPEGLLDALLPRLDALEDRLARIETLLEARVGTLAKTQPVQATDAIASIRQERPVRAAPTIEQTVEAVTPVAPIEVAPPAQASEQVVVPVQREVAAAEEQPRAAIFSETTPEEQREDAGMESKVGLTIANRVGAVTLVLGIAFFFRWASDNGWIGPAGRVMLGVLAGFAALGAAEWRWRKGQAVFAQGVTATGTAILYLAFYAAFDSYHLIPQSVALAALVATTAMASVLALRYKSLAVAALGLIAAYITPLLLSTGEDHPWFLCGYLLLVNFGATELAERGQWLLLERISFAATVLIYGGWLLNNGTREQNWAIATLAALALFGQKWRTPTPILFASANVLCAWAIGFIISQGGGRHFSVPVYEAASLLLAAALGLAYAGLRSYPLAALAAFLGFWFQPAWLPFAYVNSRVLFLTAACGFLLFTGWSYWRLGVKRDAPTTRVFAMLSLNGVLFFLVAYEHLNAKHHIWLGPVALFVAGVYLAFGVLLHRRGVAESDRGSVLLGLGMALAFLTLAIPIQFSGFTITIAWAIQGAAVAWIGARFKNENATLAALFLFALVALRLVAFDIETLPDPAAYSALWNTRFLTFAISGAAMLLGARWSTELARPAALAEYFGGHLSLLLGLFLEVGAWAARTAAPENRLSKETFAISILLAMYAVILIAIGVATRTAIDRITGLSLLGIVIVKLYAWDVWQVGSLFRILAFVILGILLLATSFLYSRFRQAIQTWLTDEKTAA